MLSIYKQKDSNQQLKVHTHTHTSWNLYNNNKYNNNNRIKLNHKIQNSVGTKIPLIFYCTT
jgi:hypothetical protein